MPIHLLGFLVLAGVAQPQPALKLIREFTLDAATGVSFGSIAAMDLAPDGSLVAVDLGNGVIYRFTAAGRLRDSLGHQGQGPGEFLGLAGLAVGPSGEVALADIKTRRLTVWNADGTLKGAAPTTGGMPIELLWRGPQPILGVMTFAPGTGPTARFAPVTLGAEAIQGDPIAIFQDPRTEELATAVTCGMCRRALSSDGRLLAAAPDTVYRISEVSPAGKAVRSWTRADAAASRRTDAEIEAVERRRAAGSAGSRRPGRANRPAPIIPRGDIRFRPRVQGFGIDAAGRLLALVNNAGSARPVVDIFGADARHLGTVRPAETLTAMVVRGKRVAALAENDDGEHVIHVYRIE